MWGLLKKAGEYLAPSAEASRIEDFIESCNSAARIVKEKIGEETPTLQNDLAQIQGDLIEEAENIDMPCFDYLVNTSTLQQLAASLGQNSPAVHFKPVMKFFLAFINTKLNIHFAQKIVHTPITILASKLEYIYTVAPDQAREFASEIWTTARKSPLLLEMMCMQDGSETKYPLIDFLIAALFTVTPTGSFARDSILSLFTSGEPNGLSGHPIFMPYAIKHLYPKISELLIMNTDGVETIQFSGSITEFINWADQVLIRTKGFDPSEVFASIDALDNSRKLLALSFLVSFFSSYQILEAAERKALSPEIIQTIKDALVSNDEILAEAAVSLIKALFMTDLSIPFTNETIDTVSLLNYIPSEWLVESDGSTSLTAYKGDAMSRINFFLDREEGNDLLPIIQLFSDVLVLFKRFKSLKLRFCLSITHMIAIFVAARPDLINSELVEAYSEVISQYSEVQTVSIPDDVSIDTPDVRAAILAEFGKELHGSYTAAIRLSTSQNL